MSGGIAFLLLAALPLPGCQSGAQRAAALAAKADQLAASGNVRGAIAALNSASAADGNNADVWVRLAHLQLQLSDPASASTSFQRALELAPDNIDALENLAVLAVRGNEIDDAKRYMEPLLLLQPNDPAGLLAKGAVALREHRNADAKAASDQLIASNPELGESYLLDGRALVAIGRPREAIAILEKRAKVEADRGTLQELLELLLDTYQLVGDIGGIRSVSLRLHDIVPADPRYTMESARARHAQGRDDEARALVDGLERQYPHATAILQAIADYWRGTLPPDAALVALRGMAARATVPGKATIAGRMIDMGQPQAALQLLAPYARGTVTTATVDTDTAYARALVAAGRVSEARALIDRVLDYDGANIAALIIRARMLLAEGKLTAALADAQLASTGDQTNQEAALLTARIYATQGNGVLAQQAYALAVQAFPASFPVLETYTDWLIDTHRPGSALFPLASFARRHPGDLAAWRQYARACAAAADSCIDEARAGSRGPG